MNPSYRIKITVHINAHKESRDREVVYISAIDFPPYTGLTLEFTNEEQEHLEITLGDVKYDMENRMFVEYQEDNALVEMLREASNPECTISKETMADYMASYESFGFASVPLILPTAQVVRTA